MKKIKLSLRRRFPRLLKFGLIIAALAVGIALYRYYFVPQPATIAKLTEDIGGGITFTQTVQQEDNGGGGTLTTSDGKKTTVKNTAELPAAKKFLLDGNKWVNGKCETSAPAAGTGGATATTPITCSGRSSRSCENTAGCYWDGNSCKKDDSYQPGTTGGVPAADVITADATLCPVGNTTAPVGSWVATGEGLDANGNVCTFSGCPFRACVKVEAGCKINYKNKVKCGEILATDPTKLVASNAMGCQYFNTEVGQSSTDCAKPLATCYLGGTAYPSGSTKEGKVCNDGEWKVIGEGGYDQKLCDFVYGAGKTTFNNSNGQCVTKTVVTTPSTTKDACTGITCQEGKTCQVLTNGWECIPTGKSAGEFVAKPGDCLSGKATYETSRFQNSKTRETPWRCTGAANGTSVNAMSDCASGFGLYDSNAKKYLCRDCVEGINSQDKTKKSYFTCEGGKAVYHTCPNGEPYKNDNNQFVCPSATPAQPGSNVQTGSLTGGISVVPTDVTNKVLVNPTLKVGDGCSPKIDGSKAESCSNCPNQKYATNTWDRDFFGQNITICGTAADLQSRYPNRNTSYFKEHIAPPPETKTDIPAKPKTLPPIVDGEKGTLLENTATYDQTDCKYGGSPQSAKYGGSAAHGDKTVYECLNSGYGLGTLTIPAQPAIPEPEKNILPIGKSCYLKYSNKYDCSNCPDGKYASNLALKNGQNGAAPTICGTAEDLAKKYPNTNSIYFEEGVANTINIVESKSLLTKILDFIRGLFR